MKSLQNKKIRKIALIPARSGSVRIKDKNIVKFNGKPLIYYTIKLAKNSKLFDDIFVVTDKEKYKKISEKYGATVPSLRPKNTAGKYSPDISWVKWILKKTNYTNLNTDIFFILRPTSPFRKVRTLKNAWKLFNKSKTDSLRAVQKCKEHPGKMWKLKKNFIQPLIKKKLNGSFWHSNKTLALPKYYIQNASLEISWVKNPLSKNSISGTKIKPFFSSEYEGFDINTPEDLKKALEISKKVNFKF